MKQPDSPFDSGLQIERTLLAWRRTTLSVAVVSAAGVRFTAPVIGAGAIAVGAAGVLLALVAYLLTGIRYRQVHRSLQQSSVYTTKGWVPMVLAVATLLLGVLAMAYLLTDTTVTTLGKALPS